MCVCVCVCGCVCVHVRKGSEEASALQAAVAEAEDTGDDLDPRLIVTTGDITNPLLVGHACAAIVNRCNWRFVAAGADPVRGPSLPTTCLAAPSFTTHVHR